MRIRGTDWRTAPELPAERSPWCAADTECVSACPACAGMLTAARLDGLVDWSESAAAGRWRLMVCEACGSASLSPRPTRGSIGRAYDAYYTHAEPDALLPPTSAIRRMRRRMRDGYLHACFGYTTLAPFPFGAAVLDRTPLGMAAAFWVRHLPLPQSGARLLDVGSGQGSQLRRMASLGWTATGLDFDRAAVVAGRRHGLDIRQGDLLLDRDQFEDASFDAITLSHVIEHLYEPVATIQVGHELLRSGGAIWVATPNFASLGRRVARGSWRGLEPPRHITVYTAYGLLRMLRTAGFVDVRLIRCPPKERWYWEQSAVIGRRAGNCPPLLSRRWVRTAAALTASALAFARPAFGDEIVVIGRKP